MRYLLLLFFFGPILNGCLNIERRQELSQVSEEPMGGEESLGDEESMGAGESMGGEEPILVEDPRTGMTWVHIPEGSFMMGSEVNVNEQPIHPVIVQAFQMSETEVTVGQYRKCVEAGRCSEPITANCSPSTWSASSSDKEDHPINCVDWGQARTFAVWTGGDLPTEAQWEYAARGGEGYEYAGSDNADEVAWYNNNSQDSTQSVQTKRANGYGLYDMSGNVWEWTLDEWHGNYQGAPSQAETPWGNILPCRLDEPCNGSGQRLIRGGGWDDGAGNLRVALRYDTLPGNSNLRLGFRVSRTLP